MTNGAFGMTKAGFGIDKWGVRKGRRGVRNDNSGIEVVDHLSDMTGRECHFMGTR